MPRRSPGASPEAFVTAWQSAESVLEVAKVLRMSRNACYERARRYRLAGVPLITHGDARIDVLGLRRLAEKLAKERAA